MKRRGRERAKRRERGMPARTSPRRHTRDPLAQGLHNGQSNLKPPLNSPLDIKGEDF